LWPTAGLRNPKEYSRDGPLLLHWSVKPLVEAKQYALDEQLDHLRYVEDAPLHGCSPSDEILIT
jgi:hypothetical protein